MLVTNYNSSSLAEVLKERPVKSIVNGGGQPAMPGNWSRGQGHWNHPDYDDYGFSNGHKLFRWQDLDYADKKRAWNRALLAATVRTVGQVARRTMKRLVNRKTDLASPK